MKDRKCRNPFRIITGSVLAGVTALLLGSFGPLPAAAAGLNGDAAYSEGPQTCAKCHRAAYDDWLAHGHSRKLGIGGPALDALDGRFGLSGNARAGGFLLPRHDKKLFKWKNILFIVGASKHWKTRFVGLDGYVITKNGANQYNWQDGTFSNYHKDEKKAYSCGTCHTTGYRKDGKVFAEQGFPGVTKKGSPGIVGDWAHFNITCEACHGPAAAHLKKPIKTNVVVDRAAKQCGTCHTRGKDDNVVIAKGGFIRHHEQYPEHLNSPHKDLSCGDCHQPHVTRAQGMKVAEGNKAVCDTCHADQRAAFQGSAMQKAGVACKDCHMGRATKSAIKKGPYEGDVWTHIMKINPAADYTMFSADGKSAKDAMSLEFACMRCHAGASKAEYAKITDFHAIGK
jgi:predicted CXXCH cytochrome family protein